jgi:hypothetical protein
MDTFVNKRDQLEGALVAAMAAAGVMRWGVDDCSMWCADILRVALGYDAAKPFRGRYRSRNGARRVMGKGGLPAALRNAARRHGWKRIQEGTERVGDIGIAVAGNVSSTVICRAPGWFVGRNEAGWTAMPSKHVRLMWAVV